MTSSREAEVSIASTTADPLARAWPEGTPVTLRIDGVILASGRVAFVDDGWVFWNEPAPDGRVYPHASRPDVLVNGSPPSASPQSAQPRPTPSAGARRLHAPARGRPPRKELRR